MRVPFKPGDVVVKWKDCPHCGGRGWFLVDPFKASGAGNMAQCQTCKSAHDQLGSDERNA